MQHRSTIRVPQSQLDGLLGHHDGQVEFFEYAQHLEQVLDEFSATDDGPKLPDLLDLAVVAV